MVQRVPAHLGETTTEAFSPWLMIAGVVLLIVIVCAVLAIITGGVAGFFGGATATPTPTRTPRAVTPIVTVIPVTLPPPTPTPGPTPVIVKYKVKSGDSLIEIAAKYKVSVQAIKNANNLKDDTIRAGDELIIPLPTPTPPPGANLAPAPFTTPTALSLQSPPSSSALASTAGVLRHTVQRGDTLISIAASYGSTVDALRLANQLDSDLLSIGQLLQVPVGAWTPTAVPAAVVVASATPTAQFAYAAPSLMFPPDNATFRGKQAAPALEWVAPGALKPNEFYVVHLETIAGEERRTLPSLTVRQGTSVKLDPAIYYPSGANPNGAQFAWYVVIVSQTTGNNLRASSVGTQTSASSPPSATRMFMWY